MRRAAYAGKNTSFEIVNPLLIHILKRLPLSLSQVCISFERLEHSLTLHSCRNGSNRLAAKYRARIVLWPIVCYLLFVDADRKWYLWIERTFLDHRDLHFWRWLCLLCALSILWRSLSFKIMNLRIGKAGALTLWVFVCLTAFFVVQTALHAASRTVYAFSRDHGGSNKKPLKIVWQTLEQVFLIVAFSVRRHLGPIHRFAQSGSRR